MFDVQTVPSVASLLNHQFNLGIPILIIPEHPHRLVQIELFS